MNQQKIGQFLKTLRSQKSITQAELAELLGVSNRSISRWENGTTMPDFDLVIELAKYEETMLKIADYNNIEREFFSKRMCIMFGAAILGMVVFAVIYLLGLERIQPYASIVNVTSGFVSGTLITGLAYASRYIVKLKASRTRLITSLRNLKHNSQ